MRRGLVSMCVVGAVLAGGGLGAGCSGDDGGAASEADESDPVATPDEPVAAPDDGGDPATGAGGLTLEGLAGASDACPLDLTAAVEGAGLPPAGAATVRVDTGADAGAGGTFVECVQPVDGGEVSAVLFATEEPGAFNLLLPQVMGDLEQTFEQAEELAGRAADAAPGDLIDLGPNTPVAAGVITVEGAESAVLYVDAGDSPRPEQAQSIATRLLDQA